MDGWRELEEEEKEERGRMDEWNGREGGEGGRIRGGLRLLVSIERCGLCPGDCVKVLLFLRVAKQPQREGEAIDVL